MTRELIKKFEQQATDNILGVPQLNTQLFAQLVINECKDAVSSELAANEIDRRFAITKEEINGIK